jgi:hypothetical protein
VRTASRYRTVHAGTHELTAQDLVPDDLRHALELIAEPGRAH